MWYTLQMINHAENPSLAISLPLSDPPKNYAVQHTEPPLCKVVVSVGPKILQLRKILEMERSVLVAVER